MGAVESAFWEQVVADGHRVPADRPLAELTTELTAMLGSTDPYVRDALAIATLSTWVSEGVYDELLEGLGDGMAAGLVIGLGTTSSDTVFRRSSSASVLARCIARDNAAHLLPPDTVLRWGDRLMSWLVRERDLRGSIPGKGSPHTVAHGAAALGALAGAESIGRLELTVLLDVIADRLVEPTDFRFAAGEEDALAVATMTLLRRDVLTTEVLDPWLARLGQPSPADESPVVAANLQAYLRALHLQLALSPPAPACRADLLLSLIAVLRRTNPGVL